MIVKPTYYMYANLLLSVYIIYYFFPLHNIYLLEKNMKTHFKFEKTLNIKFYYLNALNQQFFVLNFKYVI